MTTKAEKIKYEIAEEAMKSIILDSEEDPDDVGIDLPYKSATTFLSELTEDEAKYILYCAVDATLCYIKDQLSGLV